MYHGDMQSTLENEKLPPKNLSSDSQGNYCELWCENLGETIKYSWSFGCQLSTLSNCVFAEECSQRPNRRAHEVGGYCCGVNHLTTMTTSVFLNKISQGCLSGPEAKWQSMIPVHVSNLVCSLKGGGSVQAAGWELCLVYAVSNLCSCTASHRIQSCALDCPSNSKAGTITGQHLLLYLALFYQECRWSSWTRILIYPACIPVVILVKERVCVWHFSSWLAAGWLIGSENKVQS